MFEISSFLDRKNLTHSSLAEKIDCSAGLVGMWASKKAVPSYEKCVELLKNGMTISELFGEEIARETKMFPFTKEEIFENADNFEKKVGNAIVNLINGGFFKFAEKR